MGDGPATTGCGDDGSYASRAPRDAPARRHSTRRAPGGRRPVRRARGAEPRREPHARRAAADRRAAAPRLPRVAGPRGGGAHRRRDRPAGRRQVVAAVGADPRVARAPGRSVAVLAVDPSSKRSGGSLLGDRARIAFDPADERVFIRSTAAAGRLGGLAPATREAAARAGGGVRRRRRGDGRRRARARRTSPRWPTPSPSSCSRPRATRCSSSRAGSWRSPTCSS